MTQYVPYWTDTTTPFAGADPGELEGTVDVAVVGGGFTGLSAALALAHRGASVVVLEMGKIVSQASGRNGGHVNNGTSVDFGGLAASRGLPVATALYQAYDSAVETVERIVQEEQITCSFRRSGKIKVASKPAHYEKLARSFELLQQGTDTDTRLIPPSRTREEVGSDMFHGGLVHERSAQMHMGRFGAGLADAARRRGVRIFESAAVTAMVREAGGHRITTPRGDVLARQVFLATGPSRKGPFGWIRRRVIPVGSYVLATEPLTQAQLDDIMPTRRNATTTLNVGNYFRISPDDRLIWGGRARFALPGPGSDIKSGRVLEAGLNEVFPQLGKPRIDYCWGGVIDLTKDRLPRAGERDGVHYAMGFSGHGTQMSVHIGQLIARRMAGEKLANPLGGLDWPAIPGHFGSPWFMPLVGAYYRLQDRLH